MKIPETPEGRLLRTMQRWEHILQLDDNNLITLGIERNQLQFIIDDVREVIRKVNGSHS